MADIILVNGAEQIPKLCKRVFKYCDISLKGNSKSFEKIATWLEAKEAEKIVTWLKTKFWKNMQEDMVKALDQFQEGTQEEVEREIPALPTTEAEEAEPKLQPPHKSLQALASRKNPERRPGCLCKTCRDKDPPEEHRDCTCCQNCEGSLTENLCSCYKVCGKPENPCLGYSNVCGESQYKRRCPLCYYITTEAELQPIYRFLWVLQPNKARDVSPPMDVATASVSRTYDPQKEPRGG